MQQTSEVHSLNDTDNSLVMILIPDHSKVVDFCLVDTATTRVVPSRYAKDGIVSSSA
jgi:hypothetical protein